MRKNKCKNIIENKKNNKDNGSAILTTPIILAIGMMVVSMLIVMAVRILMPYIWYEKLSSTCIKYVFIMEEYGYLTKREATTLREELIAQGFDNDKIKLSYTNSKVSYGNPIFLRLDYEYNIKLPLMENKKIPMVIERSSVSKR